MARITLRQLLDNAAEHGYGLPAFNVNNMEQIVAIMRAATAVDSPVILQVSRGARSYAGDPMVRKMIEAAEEMFPTIPICVHQDHGNSAATCQSALDQGYTSVMMDGSLESDAKTPSSYEYNIDVTSAVRLSAVALTLEPVSRRTGTGQLAQSVANCCSRIRNRPSIS
jgi:fructose-bisphosphate aldolase class II